MGNLTSEKGLVRLLAEPRPVPGCHLVVFKELGGGKSFDRVLQPGQPLRKSLGEVLSSFVAYAVPADPSLRLRFSEQYSTGVGELHDRFVLHVTLAYHVVHPEVLVEQLERDPLGRLQDEIKDVLSRQASRLRFEDLMDESFDLAGFVLGTGEHPPRAGEPSNLERFLELAAGLGIGLDRVEVTRTYSSSKIGRGTERVEVDRKRVLAKDKARAEAEVELIRRQGAGQVEVLDSVVQGLKKIIVNVSGEVRTVHDLKGVLGQVSSIREELAGAVGGPTALPEPSVRGALGPGGDPGGRGSDLEGWWRRELGRMFEVVGALDSPRSEKRVLAGKMVHVLAEVSLGRDSDNGSLERHLEELERFAESIDLVRAVTSPEHHRYLGRFRDAAALRRSFAEADGDETEGGRSS